MSEWKEYKLGEIAEIVGGGTPSTKEESYYGGNISWLTPRDLTGYTNKYISKGERSITKEGLANSSAKIVPKNSILLTSRAPIGYLAIADNEACTNQGFKSLVVNSTKADFNFVFYLLKANMETIKSFGTGTTFAEISASVVRNLKFSFPSLPTQTAIAEILSSLDDKIELNNQINKDLEALAQALFKQWFIDFEFPNENGEPYRSSGGEMVDSEFGEIPKGWNTGSLSEIIEISHGYAYKGEFFSDIETSEILVTPGNFKIGGGFNLNKFKFYNGICPANYILEKGDLIVTMTDLSKEGDTLGYPALVPNINDKRLHHNQRIGKILFKQTPDYKFYLYWLMRSISYRSFVLSGASGTTVKHTSPSRICEYKTIIPELDTLKAFNDMFSGFFDVEQNNISETSFLVNLRDTLLPKLISGELKVTNNSIEV